MGSRKGVLGRGRDRGSVAPQSGLGDPRERRAAGWGGGCLIPQSPLRFFPFSLPKLPGSPRLPRQPLLPGAVTKETPCPPLPPSPSLECPPHPKQQWCGRWEGQWGGENSDSRPREGAQTYIQRAPPPRKPPSSAPQLDTQRLPDVLPPHPSAAATPQHRTKNLHPTASPTGFCSPAGPAHCPLPPPHPGGGLRPRSPN